tara:strand:+ start:55697 stop:57004 length:1308 start_codon:yes stop_codon:yes gene_type:complete
MKYHKIFLTIIILYSSFNYSQDEENKWLFEIGVNSINVENSNNSNYRLPKLSLSRYIFNNLSVGLSFSENDVSVANQELYYYSVDGILKYSINKELKVLGLDTNPYIFAGYGLSNFGESDISFGSKNTSYGPSAGFGIDFQVSKNIALNTGISYKSLNERNAYSNLQHVVGIKFNFSKGDSDGDGVPDKKDNCPDHPGLIELNGCPDSDGDGVLDKEDLCPTIYGSISMKGCADSDKDGVADIDDPCPKLAGSNGSPCPDSDGDGLNNNIDNCPNEFGPISNGGCKLSDSDNDNIPNIKDNCPNESGLTSLNGCPAIPESLSEFLEENSEYFFDFDSFYLDQKQKNNISDLSRILIQFNYIKIGIEGHASYEGESSYNLLLSNRRSFSVKDQLIKNGVKESRINIYNYGEEKPKYSDSPLSEREKNRRAVITVEK